MCLSNVELIVDGGAKIAVVFYRREFSVHIHSAESFLSQVEHIVLEWLVGVLTLSHMYNESK